LPSLRNKSNSMYIIHIPQNCILYRYGVLQQINSRVCIGTSTSNIKTYEIPRRFNLVNIYSKKFSPLTEQI
jgi:hypothetical protein